MVKQLRVKWGVNSGNPKRDENMKKLVWRIFAEYSYSKLQQGVRSGKGASTSPDVLFHNDIIELMRPFKLDREYWYNLIWDYVRTGSVDEYTKWHDILYLDSAPVLRFETQQGTGKRKIIMEIGEHTTLKDVKAIWNRVEDIRKHLNPQRPKFKPWKNFERDSKVYALYLEDKILPEIANAIDKEYGGDLTETNIRKIITTYKNRFGLLDGKKKLLSSRRTRG